MQAPTVLGSHRRNEDSPYSSYGYLVLRACETESWVPSSSKLIEKSGIAAPLGHVSPTLTAYSTRMGNQLSALHRLTETYPSWYGTELLEPAHYRVKMSTSARMGGENAAFAVEGDKDEVIVSANYSS